VGCKGPDWKNRSIRAFASHTPPTVCSIQGFLKPPINIHPEEGNYSVCRNRILTILNGSSLKAGSCSLNSSHKNIRTRGAVTSLMRCKIVVMKVFPV
jgi:hypothetical protein